ncbi:DUF6809 family protein [Akkermansia muciniphila]|uniref:DUF6809 family protein n=1 Tax=Akkermansia muciniphila TaxID=239935 RepID=UPI00122F08E3|nr:DUF6809 family protein [Akkermansia muciniphila]KAA3382964.1 hypothetical protein F1912_13120 [Akkermansia muciniphila]
MYKTIQALYHGNLSFTDTDYKRGTPYAKDIKELADLEAALLETLEGPQRAQFERFVQCQMELSSIEAEADFIAGYRAGTRLALEAWQDGDGGFSSFML